MSDFPAPSDALSILKTLREAGFEAYFCGGAVRDWLMGRMPKDFDIATSAPPQAIEELFPHTVAVGKSFGVMQVVREGRSYEVATFRSDGAYEDGRRPNTIAFATAEEDVRRRDFTMNALLYDPIEGRLLDFVGGAEDIRRRILRTVGEPRKRFLEDHLRLLRAVRFAAWTGFSIEHATFSAIREMAGLAGTVSAERIGIELTRMFSEGYARRSLDLLDATGLLLHLLPEVARLHGIPQPDTFHPEGDVYTHTALMLTGLDEDLVLPPGKEPPDSLELLYGSEKEYYREVLGWAVLLHDVGKPDTLSYGDRLRFHDHDQIGATIAEKILERWKRPRRVTEAVADLIRRHIHFAALGKMRLAKLRRFLQEPLFPLHLELHRLDCTSSHRMLENYEFALQAWREEKARPPVLQPLLTGHDLIAMGYSPGPRMGEILQAIEDARLEGLLDSPEAARQWVLRHYPLSCSIEGSLE